MKIILLTIILLISIVTFSQEKIIGKYCSVPIGESDVTCIDFKEKNRFAYVVSGCLGISTTGRGKFELKDEKLNLIFDKAEQVSKNEIKITEFKVKSEKEVKFEFKVRDENGIEIPANILRTSYRKHFFFDELNKVFIVDKNSPKANYRIEFIGYETVELEVDNNTDKIIEVNLFPSQEKVISDKEITLKWIKVNETEFKTGTNF
ncbi:hypothetical protein PW52_09580 [Tamlana sedimentorum]|uniref:Uncharacterized protein n=1 Tax=Neotamlana sedimentorum TaxID=1435349 RepID=A0A0D7WC77_9FLAO|nr:hypothetical protein [Tamlana sedimentorum]KJD35347.1 hypothetical protein PW52_09580 [Tamlana sedimentorum]